MHQQHAWVRWASREQKGKQPLSFAAIDIVKAMHLLHQMRAWLRTLRSKGSSSIAATSGQRRSTDVDQPHGKLTTMAEECMRRCGWCLTCTRDDGAAQRKAQQPTYAHNVQAMSTSSPSALHHY